VKGARYDDDRRSVKLGSYTFTFHRRSDYERFARKLRTMS
jgi:hypothetical protein